LSLRLVYYVTKDHSYTLTHFLEDWSPQLSSHFNVRYYDDADFPSEPDDPGTVVIFSDIDRLTRDQKVRASGLADRLLLAGQTVLNHPSSFVGRADLLKRLHGAGCNNFKAWRLAELFQLPKIRYPVFLRTESGHGGSLSELLADPLALAKALLRQLARILLGRVAASDILIVEFEDVSDPKTGISEKYSYLKIGRMLVPRHVLFSKAWMIKYSDIYSDVEFKLENSFIENCPFQSEIERVFKIAGIEYGRIDFSVRGLDGAVQVWEINTNPSIIGPLANVLDQRRALQANVMQNIAEAFFKLQ